MEDYGVSRMAPLLMLTRTERSVKEEQENYTECGHQTKLKKTGATFFHLILLVSPCDPLVSAADTTDMFPAALETRTGQ